MEAVVQRIPHDIWLNISRFIPRDVLVTLSTVNRSFYVIANIARYETITFDKLDRRTKWLCANLSDPDIGRSSIVRCVDIIPWVVKPHVKSYRNQSANLWRLVAGLFDPNCTTQEMNQLITKRINKVITRVSGAMKDLRNVTEYRLGWDQSSTYHPELFRAFLCPVLIQLKGKLVTLSLKVPPEMLLSLAPIALPHLEHLRVVICTLDMEEKRIREVFDSFTVFVNNLYPTLKSLSITSICPSKFLDLTRFFNTLGFFPHLDNFSISLPFEGTHLSSPYVLVKFLEKHRNKLQHLQFSTSRCGVSDSPPNPSCKYWIPNILAAFNTPFPQLQGIQLALRPLRANLAPVTDFIRKHTPGIKHLTLTERSLTYEEIRTILDMIVNPITSELEHLSLRIRHISPALLDLLASRLPHLAHLELSFSEVIARAAYVNAGYPSSSRKAELDFFKKEVRANRSNYAHWELRTIGIPQGPPSCMWLADLERLFVECIPALQSVKELPSPDLLY